MFRNTTPLSAEARQPPHTLRVLSFVHTAGAPGSGTTSSTANGLNQLASHGGANTSHDAMGNMTSNGVKTGLRQAAGCPSIAACPLLRDASTTSFTRDDMAAEGEIQQDVAVHEKGYSSFIAMMKWGTIISLVLGLITVLVISE